MKRFLVGALAIWVLATVVPVASAAEKKPQGNVQNGRAVFNGKGNCLACHGKDAYLNQRPQQSPEIAKMIEELVPPPANFRDPATLQAKRGDVLFRDIKSGRAHSAMFPKKFLTDAEIGDLVAYLLSIKAEMSKAGMGRQEKGGQP